MIFIGKNYNDLYYFQKLKNIRATYAKCIYQFPRSRKITSFPYFCTHLILFPKVENIVPIHFFPQNTKSLIELSFPTYIYLYIYTYMINMFIYR